MTLGGEAVPPFGCWERTKTKTNNNNHNTKNNHHNDHDHNNHHHHQPPTTTTTTITTNNKTLGEQVQEISTKAKKHILLYSTVPTSFFVLKQRHKQSIFDLITLDNRFLFTNGPWALQLQACIEAPKDFIYRLLAKVFVN